MFLIDDNEYDPFSDLFSIISSKSVREGPRLSDMQDNGDVYVASIELPGYKKGDIKIETSGNTLSVSADRDGKVKYENTFSIKDDVDTTSIAANLEYGILTLTLPKKEVSKPRKIKVQ